MVTRDSLRRRRQTASIFRETDVLSDMLEDLTHMYAGERKPVSVNTGKRSAMDMGTGYHVTTNIRDEIGRVLSGPNKLRYIIDDLAHAIEHDRVTDFDKLVEMVTQYSDNEAKTVIAATVVTLLEDQFVDTSRVNRHRGHRRRVAFKHAVQMRGALRPPLSDLRHEAVPMEAFIQLATAGYIKDPDALDKHDQRIFKWMRDKIREARNEQDQTERLNIATDIIDQLLRLTQTSHTNAKNHVFSYPPPTHDLDPMLSHFNIEQDEDGSSFLDELKSRLNRAKEKAKDRQQGQQPDDLPDDFDPEDYDTDNEAEADATHADDNDTEGKTGDGSEAEASQSGEENEQHTEEVVGEEREEADEQQQASAADGEAGTDQQRAEGLDERGEESDFSYVDTAEGSDGIESVASDTEGGNLDDELQAQPAGSGEPSEKQTPQTESGGAEEETASISEALDAGDVGEWYSAGDQDEYISPSEDAENRFKSLKRAVVKRQMGSLEERRAERDERIEENNSVTTDIEKEVERRGLAEEIAREFRKIKTRDRNVRDTKGRRLEMRQAQRNIAGNPSIQDVWLRRKRAEVGDRAVGVAVDLSGSMDAKETMVALGTLSKAVNIIGDELVITTFHQRDSSMVTGPDEQFRWEHLDAARAGGKTPTAHGILDGQLLLDECDRREKVLFVLTDGRPNVSLEQTGGNALQDAKAQVRDARRDDIRVIGLGLSSVDESQMEDMFGKDNYIMVNERTLARDLVEAYKSQLSVTV